MSNITLSASVRSNLLSLQNTAALLDTTQTRLATGNKVNSALDNPTSYFTASALNSRASDLGNLLDSVGNAVQTIQAANDGITSITKLVESAQATANQALQLSAQVDDPGKAAIATADINGGAFTTIVDTKKFSINGVDIVTNTGDTAALIQAKINAQTATTGVSATSAAGKLTLHAIVGANNTDGHINVGDTDAGTAATVGLTVASTPGTAAVAAVPGVQVDNPARAALITQYNGLLTQIDQLTKDAGYNGNNLLTGASTQLKVVFNETGTSNLTIAGKDTSATGLGLSQLTVGDEFSTNAKITTVLSSLKTASDTLRADASSFGSNLSIVQTRQDFTKALINTLQTGASNLTLADSNEEAANLLALQTRQSLST
ncbi:MAG: flagellin hook IN motif-containing protein, partial [Devosia sp.]